MRCFIRVIAVTLLAAPAFAESAFDYVAPCATGDQDACLRGAQLAQAAQDQALLATFSRTGCQHGNLISCSDEGMMIISGLTPDGDVQRAVGLVRRGCDGGYFRACANLGYLYFTGTGVAQDIGAAAKYYQRGCDGGSAAACRNLGLMVLDGEVAPGAGQSADTLFDRACDLGDASAC
ncbi:MAG: tetratricopeptide repeat protein [Paracoccus sp. (in: a-proteobacteria)]|nr:tetratricopeptide repeat protein [Paracoccus sp. (in: a-proteobacteria)]